jgi:hypothetical protein
MEWVRKLMRKTVLFLCLVCLLPAGGITAQETSSSVPEPYTEEEFPLWAKDLRRFEVVLIGSLPFTFLYTSISYSLIRYAANGFDAAFAPALQPGGETVPMTRGEQIGTFIAGIGVAVLVAVADQIIIHIKRNRAEAEAANERPRQE